MLSGRGPGEGSRGKDLPDCAVGGRLSLKGGAEFMGLHRICTSQEEYRCTAVNLKFRASLYSSSAISIESQPRDFDYLRFLKEGSFLSKDIRPSEYIYLSLARPSLRPFGVLHTVHLRHPSRLFYASATTQLYVTCGSTLPNWSMVADLILNFEPTSSEGNSGKGNEFRVMERDKDGDRSGGEQKEND
ncbi:unnamed protein product, partial [Nesidiocoris tenuis]